METDVHHTNVCLQTALAATHARFQHIAYFLTFWSVLFTVASIFLPNLHHYINLSYLTTITLILGLYLSWIHPRFYTFQLQPNTPYVTLDHPLQRFIIVDMFFHITAFIYIMHRYGFYTNPQSIPLTLLFIILYTHLAPIQETYHTDPTNLKLLFTATTLLWILLALAFSK